ncbi:MAG: phosphorylase [Deltaproteobacteria bacterium]|nr:phosphorylase [Deltaproteobacteria bacterium]
MSEALRTRGIEPGVLWPRALERAARALRCGALRPIPTEQERVAQGGVRFVVRMAPSLRGKAAAAGQGRADPFSPYDPDLFVADLSSTHVCLLNKYNVIENHLLVVTRAFEEQLAPLARADFEALWLCLRDVDGLGFYNAGEAAGASQRHKHLQLVALPLSAGGPGIPIEPLLESAGEGEPTGAAARLPFRNCFARRDFLAAGSAPQAAAQAHEIYGAMAAALDLAAGGRPYNLLVTRRWMLLVPRSVESFQSISVNALGFAGALLVRDATELDAVKRHGPMTVLGRVALPQREAGGRER